MANTPKKVVDPTEAALSAIQEALNMGEPPASERSPPQPRGRHAEPAPIPPARAEELPIYPEETLAPRAANDDRETIGQILQAVQSNRPDRGTYLTATVFTVLWLICAGIVGYAFLPSLQLVAAESASGVLLVAGLAAILFAPIILFFLSASIARRSQEMRLIAQSMSQLAIRFSEPETVASDAVVTVGQAIRREVAAMGDGVERAIARAGELESLVANEVAALERGFADNEVRIRALLQDIAHQRDNLVGQAEQVRNSIAGVQVDLKQDIAVISDAIAARVDEVTQRITQELTERGDHIVRALGNNCENLIFDLDERGASLLEKLRQNANETSRAVYDAADQLNSSLNFKTGNVHSEFAELADRIEDMMNERLDRVTAGFGDKSVQIVDDISTRTEQIHDSVKATGDSLLVELELRGNDLVSKITDAGVKLAEHVVGSGEKANITLQTTIADLVGKTIGNAEEVHEKLTTQIQSFEELVKDRGGELAERLTRDSTMLGSLITRHVAEFDRSVKTYGGEIVERIGQRTGEITETLKTYVADLDGKVEDLGARITGTIDGQLGQFSATIGKSIESLDGSLGANIKTFHDGIEISLASANEKFDSRARLLDESLKVHLGGISSAITDGSAHAVAALDRRIAGATEVINQQTANLTETIAARFQDVRGAFESHADAVAKDVALRVGQFDDLLNNRIDATTARLESSSRLAGDALVARADEVAHAISTRAADAERALATSIGAASETLHTATYNAQALLNGVSADIDAKLRGVSTSLSAEIVTAADAASVSLTNTTGTIESRLRAITGDVSSGIIAASDIIATSLKKNASETEQELTAAGSRLSTSLIARSTEAVDTLRDHTAELSHLIDEKRGLLVNALEEKRGLFVNALDEKRGQIQSVLDNKHGELSSIVDKKHAELAAIVDNVRGELAAVLDDRRGKLVTLLDDRRGQIVSSLDDKGEEIANHINRSTENSLAAIETKGFTFVQTMMSNSTELSRIINVASEVASGAVNKSLKDMQETARAAIEQTRQATSASIGELQETGKALRADTLTMFERMREGNILLQEVINSAHKNLGALEHTLANRTSELMSTLKNLTETNGVTSDKVAEQLSLFNGKTTAALSDLTSLSKHFDTQGRALAEAAALVEQSNRYAAETVNERKSTLEQLVNTIDLRTADLDQRLSRFASLLDDSMKAAESRAREIARIVADAATSGTAAIGQQFEAVRSAAEDERRLTTEAMQEVYERGTRDADVMFRQASERFAALVQNMKQMTAEMQHELESTRSELRRGVLEMPQEAAESTAQMRRVIVDQIEALAELNRIVARHGRGLDVAAPRAAMERETVGAVAGARSEAPARGGRGRETSSASALPPPDLGAPLPTSRRADAPPVSPHAVDADRDEWLTGMLNRADAAPAGYDAPRGRAPARPASGPLDSLTLDIARLVDADMAADMWSRYQRGERKAFTKRLYTPSGQKTFDEIGRKYRSDRGFKQTVDRYVTEFERLLDDVARDGRGPAELRGHLTSESGLVYTLLAHAVGRLG